jgi:hypothetical protein
MPWTPKKSSPPKDCRMILLAVATGWGPSSGGINAFNGVRPVRGARLGRSAHIAVSRCLWRVGSGLRAIPGSTAKSRQFDTVRSTGRRGTTALRARPETDVRSRYVLRRAGRRGTIAASRPPCGTGGRGVALAPAHRGVNARARRGVETSASRQRPQPYAPDRHAAESISRIIQRSG